MQTSFLDTRSSRYLRTATVHDLSRTITDTDVYTESELLKVKVSRTSLISRSKRSVRVKGVLIQEYQAKEVRGSRAKGP